MKKVKKIVGIKGLIIRKFHLVEIVKICNGYPIVDEESYKNFIKNFELTKRENRFLQSKWQFPNLNPAEIRKNRLKGGKRR